MLAAAFGPEIADGRLTLITALLERRADLSYNDVLLRALAHASCFVGVQGGTSYAHAYFGGEAVVFHPEWAGRARERQKYLCLLYTSPSPRDS